MASFACVAGTIAADLPLVFISFRTGCAVTRSGRGGRVVDRRAAERGRSGGNTVSPCLFACSLMLLANAMFALLVECENCIFFSLLHNLLMPQCGLSATSVCHICQCHSESSVNQTELIKANLQS